MSNKRVKINHSQIQNHSTQNNIIKPTVGTLLFRYENSDLNDELYKPISFAVVKCDIKRRGRNKGIIDTIMCCHVEKIDGSYIYYDNSHVSIFRLNNRGNWFNKNELKIYTYVWDSPLIITANKYAEILSPLIFIKSPPININNNINQYTLDDLTQDKHYYNTIILGDNTITGDKGSHSWGPRGSTTDPIELSFGKSKHHYRFPDGMENLERTENKENLESMENTENLESMENIDKQFVKRTRSTSQPSSFVGITKFNLYGSKQNENDEGNEQKDISTSKNLVILPINNNTISPIKFN